MILSLLFGLAIAFLSTLVLAPIVIPLLHRLHFGQYIRREGPKSHQKKAGTPTMGGVIFLLGLIIGVLIMAFKYHAATPETWMLLFVTLGFGLVGLLDDFIKVVMKRNMGLTSRQKMLGQLVIAVAFWLILTRYDYSTYLYFPGTDWMINLGWFYPVFIIFLLVGVPNATNLTDGMDGLLSGLAAIVFAAYTVIAWTSMSLGVATFATAMLGALLGFLIFNAHPARVFMGDTGSLAVGGAIAGMAILTNTEILLAIIGGVFVIETLSVIIQVISFKTTGKRVFKMSPIHHHFELSGWSEWKVVTVFWLVGLILAVIGVYLEVGMTF
ncbi:phospho-N-acetylmuramoyl-pentapeptide-transferase [Sporolactobacillus sp. Y61]|jgi:phospho-N-acetylmuramoyl-pentapeptide-transferase|uniref:Phospho-N-acetylmuramoyl-pentapeptide-transferase n=1 Tax=Sporolactobacillus sp. Y61 TaxID=3160863 RepID=A0AAU8ICE7_9BACL|nr:phospho-N-acetylmuramoyl-pentapeptide-transferase [Sporolactobacillus sp. THM19-2]RYL92872.1 phospho-N-acetylmuramoyl-pentapeptide-transferase [Sporolactobacillus sp. THM19-2]